MSKTVSFPGYGPGKDKSEERREEGALLYEHLQLILDHTDEILGTERYFYCYPGNAFLSLAYLGGGQIPLGALLLLWRDGEMLDACEECGGVVHIIGAGGSPLSGSHSWWGGCPRCGERRTGHRERFSTLWPPAFKMIRKYKNEPVIKRGKRPKFSWSKGLVGERTPDEVIKPRIEGVSVATLVRELKQKDARGEESACRK